MEYYSHIRDDKKEVLIAHLKEVAELASGFAASFGAEKIAEQIGLLHDLGKHTDAFQRVLKGELHHIDHAVVGAQYYWNVSGDEASEEIVDDLFIAEIIANCINSHHSVLHGYLTDDFDEDYLGSRPGRGTDNGKTNALSGEQELLGIDTFVKNNHLIKNIIEDDHPDAEKMTKEAMMLYERIIFSCLVDADYSSTAAFYSKENYKKYLRKSCLDPKLCLEQLSDYRKSKGYGISTDGLNGLRNEVYEACANAGKKYSPSVFTLTAPTGTGKTMALIRFALEQALRNGQEKIFVVLPYLSIIEQNAATYKEIFGEHICLESDSLAEIPDEIRLNADRWDYPIIVTTSVSFFETLCGAKASKERKLHNVANAVIVFDESQSLPTYLTDVTMNTLRALPAYFNTSVLLSTATQPDYHFRTKLHDIKTVELVEDVTALYDEYDRIRELTLSTNITEKETYEDLINWYDDRQQLFVFNTTSKALKMFEALSDKYGEENCFLLSSSLCSQHKSETIAEIKKKTAAGEECYVSATQCIEAGVDLDFPAGMRECAPLTSIVQTAGRINRNALGHGVMHVFVLDEDEKYGFPDSVYRNESYVTRNISEERGLHINDLSIISEYYKEIFFGDAQESTDSSEINMAVKNVDTEMLSEYYKLIDNNDEINVIVPFVKEKYDMIFEKLTAKDFCINKKDMDWFRDITVRLYGNRKVREYLDRHCRRLSMRAEYGGKTMIDWYIAEDISIYDKKRGLIRKEQAGGFIF